MDDNSVNLYCALLWNELKHSDHLKSKKKWTEKAFKLFNKQISRIKTLTKKNNMLKEENNNLKIINGVSKREIITLNHKLNQAVYLLDNDELGPELDTKKDDIQKLIKQNTMLMESIATLKKERDIYKKYIPNDLLTIAGITKIPKIKLHDCNLLRTENVMLRKEIHDMNENNYHQRAIIDMKHNKN